MKRLRKDKKTMGLKKNYKKKNQKFSLPISSFLKNPPQILDPNTTKITTENPLTTGKDINCKCRQCTYLATS